MIVYPPSQRQMASQSAKPSSQPGRPAAPRVPSFPQHPPTSVPDRDTLKPPKRAHTFHNGAPAGASHGPDTFETSETTDPEDNVDVTRGSVELDDLPIELISLTDSFIESLGAKVHPTPPNIDNLSQLFQEFYAVASSHVATHVSALAYRQSRDASPAASASSISSAASRLRSKATSLGAKDKPKVEADQQMITAEELANRKRARKALEAKRGQLEEAVERRLCEGIYGRIYQHSSTQDEAQDDKLRSKTAALALVGIGPADLGVEIIDQAQQTAEGPEGEGSGVRESLQQARVDLTRMGESRYPLGKLNHLKAAHKSIVDTLALFHPSASADEIMPMLIYTLITLPPENLHIISDLHFIQHFRWETKLTGEAAYCLTNLEAAISFLETVDLATNVPPAYPQGLTAPASKVGDAMPENTSTPKSATTAPSPSGLKSANVRRTRRLSDLVNTPAQAFGAASDAVFTTADQGLKTISNSLGESYSFLIGKLRERQQGPKESIAVPRTLDDARKLVSTPPPDEEDNASGASSTIGAEDTEQLRRPSAREDRVLNMIGGRRDTSVDSSRSASSSKKVLFAEESKGATPSLLSSGQSPAVLDQVRNLGSTFNPMARLSSIGGFRGFGRSAPTTPAASKDVGKTADGGDLAAAFPDIAAALPPKQVPKIAPPNKRFMELQSPGDLRLGEVLDLLRDYRRLANALKSMDAFEEK
ncbi:VPS9 domain-containingprotein [Purpureocillium lavendulum]|uniref:VPS9 domain-containingprotein n=1 Tax=Purpureocillium lavendulum TaxID=1247861 RepID=A0AB34G7K2_9HYPO|nr:VPS9 domain-containingprotein [Purpureocillium lavendulum]